MVVKTWVKLPVQHKADHTYTNLNPMHHRMLFFSIYLFTQQ